MSFAGSQALPTDQLFSFDDLGCENQMIGGGTGLAHLSLNGRICGIYWNIVRMNRIYTSLAVSEISDALA